MSGKHTPGPWKNARTLDGKLVWFQAAPQPPSEYYTEPVNQEHRANMVLLDAAPNMLAALIVAREFISTDRNELEAAMKPPDGSPLDPYDRMVLADYDAALLQIDAAIKQATEATPS